MDLACRLRKIAKDKSAPKECHLKLWGCVHVKGLYLSKKYDGLIVIMVIVIEYEVNILNIIQQTW